MGVHDPIVEALIQEMARRDNFGYSKYGTTTMDNPLSLIQWLQHALEETLDQAVYLKRALEKIKEHPDYAIRDHYSNVVGKIINDRVKVETMLLNMAAGKQPLPDEEKCRDLALMLGKGDKDAGELSEGKQ